MVFLTVDEGLCARDGLCALVCPLRLIVVEVGRSFPQPVSGAEQRCIECGHCLAVCPKGALSLPAMVQECPPYQAALLPDMAQLTQLVRGRRSIRLYHDRAVDRALLQQCIDLARYAPTARNSQQIGWLVIDSRVELRHLTEHVLDWMRHLVSTADPLADHYGLEGMIRAWEGGHDPVLRHAPGLVVMHGPTGHRLAVMDSTIWLTTFELVAFSQGIGTCWAGFFQLAAADWGPLQEALALPEGQGLTAAMMVGYARVRYQRLPERRPSRIVWR